MSTALTQWLYLIADLPMCPNPLITREVMWTCRDFCEKTKLWSDELTAIDIVATTAEYQLSHSGADIVGVMRAEIDDVVIDPIAEVSMDRDSTLWRTETSDDPEAYFVGEEVKLRLVDIPSADNTGGLTVWCYLKPLLAATTVPDWLYNNFRDIIEKGARSRLLYLKDTPWYDPKMGIKEEADYKRLTDEKAQKRHQGRTPARVRNILRKRSRIDF